MERQHLSQTKSAIAPSQTQSHAIARSSAHPIEELQGAIGNRAVNQLLANQPIVQAKPMFRGLSHELAIQPKQTIGAVGDKYEQKAELNPKVDPMRGYGEKQTNKTGLSNNLKAGIENLSGMAMDDVRVHYNSEKPNELQALAYTQGTEIYVAPGQERHLAHEAWHVVQQMQERVQPTFQAKGVTINNDPELEKEADVMGTRALQITTLLPGATGATAQAKMTYQQREGGTERAVLYSLARNTGMNLQSTSPWGNQVQHPVSSLHGTGVVQLAGTKPNQPSKDGKYRIKLSSKREEFAYVHRAALQLDKILPKHHTVRYQDIKDHQLYAVKIDEQDEWVELKEPIPEPTDKQAILVIDTVGYHDPSVEESSGFMEPQQEKKIYMDIKIGHFTKSGEQFKLEGAGSFMARFKQMEHDAKDTSRTSREHGYDIDASNLRSFEAAHRAVDETEKGKLKAAMEIVMPQLMEIQKDMSQDNSVVTFVGSSLFIVLNLDKPANSAVNLIDPDHPIILNEERLSDIEGEIPKDLMRKTSISGRRGWDAYKDKWKKSFSSGLDNFLRWFEARYDKLDYKTEE